MLPSKSITPFLGIWYERKEPACSVLLVSGKLMEEKILRASVRPPTTSLYSQKLLLHITREFPCESPA